MAILKITPIHIFWIIIFYTSGVTILLSTFGRNYFLVPKITQYVVGEEDLKTERSHHLTATIESKEELKEAFAHNSNYSIEDWSPPESVNASYISVPDEEMLNFHCNVCSVVTNSGQLLGKGAGSLIDQSDCVFRMNYAPTQGYEKDVGSRTDVRIIGHSNLIKDDFRYNRSLVDGLFSSTISGNPSIVLIPWLFHEELNKTLNLPYRMLNNLSISYPDVGFYVSTPEWVAASEDLFKEETGISRAQAHTWLSTGWMTILFAIESCETVNVYGMVSQQHCMNLSTSDEPYHYYANGINDTKECQYYLKSESSLTSGHKLITEKAVFARWSSRHDLNFYHPTWENVPMKNSSSKLETLFLQLYNNRPKRMREKRRQKMRELREKFKKKYGNKKFKIVDGYRGRHTRHRINRTVYRNGKRIE